MSALHAPLICMYFIPLCSHFVHTWPLHDHNVYADRTLFIRVLVRQIVPSSKTSEEDFPDPPGPFIRVYIHTNLQIHACTGSRMHCRFDSL